VCAVKKGLEVQHCSVDLQASEGYRNKLNTLRPLDSCFFFVVTY
jgi:hypothetical protein